MVLRLELLVLWVMCLAPGAITGQQTQTDSYTRYELLAPETNSFRIVYDVSATTTGAMHYFNTLRKGSEHDVTAVYDRMTGNELEWKIVDGEIAQANGHPTAAKDGEYLMVTLARKVPTGGEARLRIDKTYKDPDSYYREGEDIVFDRSLGIKRNAVVLPPGYELVACNYPSQVELEEDGRVKASFFNRSPRAVPYQLKARLLPTTARTFAPKQEEKPWTDPQGPPSGRNKSRARLDYDFAERAYQDREIVYFLQQPETHSFRLYHDYTESRTGMDRYLNIVRAGSKASDPSAYLLDTGEKLKVETLRGDQIRERGIELRQAITPETEVIAIWYDPVPEGHSVRLRIEETYTDANRYLLYGGEFVWDRSFGRPQNTVVLPEGWYLTVNSIPAVIDEMEDGRIRLYYVNDRPGGIDVYVRGRRRN